MLVVSVVMYECVCIEAHWSFGWFGNVVGSSPLQAEVLHGCVAPTLARATELLVFGYCSDSMREQNWRGRKLGMQATWARLGDLAEVTRVR